MVGKELGSNEHSPRERPTVHKKDAPTRNIEWDSDFTMLHVDTTYQLPQALTEATITLGRKGRIVIRGSDIAPATVTTHLYVSSEPHDESPESQRQAEARARTLFREHDTFAVTTNANTVEISDARVHEEEKTSAKANGELSILGGDVYRDGKKLTLADEVLVSLDTDQEEEDKTIYREVVVTVPTDQLVQYAVEKSGSGDVVLQGIYGSANVTIMNGDIITERSVFIGKENILETRYGGIRLGLANPSVSLIASTKEGEIEKPDGLVVTQSVGRRGTPQRVHGRFGSDLHPTNKIYASTRDGNITIVKE